LDIGEDDIAQETLLIMSSAAPPEIV